MQTTLLIMAAGIGSRFAVVSNSWSRLMNRAISSWIIRFMTQSKQVLTRWFLLSERILKMNLRM